MRILTFSAALALAAALLAPATWAAGPFDGTWTTKLDSIKISSKPDVYELKDGVFGCGNCAPSFSVPADGADHKVAGHSYYDTVAVTVVNDHTVRVTDKLGAKPIYEMTYSVSADGKTLNQVLKDMSGAKVATWNQVSSRVGAGASGSHAIAGSWKMDKMPGASDIGMTITYRETDDGLQMQYNGLSYDARFDGKPVLTANDPGKTLVSLKRISKDVIEETDSRGGAVTDVTRMTVSPDGKTMNVVDNNRTGDMTISFTMTKSP
jgi:hypothetical protein